MADPWTDEEYTIVPVNIESQKQIEDAVMQFVRRYMSARPESVLIDLHDSHVLITLRGVVCPAERDYARERSSRELLERLFSETFDAVRTDLEATVAAIMQCRVQRSRSNVDLLAGDVFLTVLLDTPGSSSRQSL